MTVNIQLPYLTQSDIFLNDKMSRKSMQIILTIFLKLVLGFENGLEMSKKNNIFTK